MKLLILNSTFGPDYLADLISCELITNSKSELYFNYIPDYYFKNYEDIRPLYGNGFTVFKKLSLEAKTKFNIKILSNDEEIKTLVSQKYFDAIIYTSIWRYNSFLSDVIKYYGKDQVKVIDGEDIQNVFNIYDKVSYFKRELAVDFEKFCYPISFAFPSYLELGKLEIGFEQKSYLLSPCTPYLRGTYNFVLEDEYYNQYRKSFFAITTKKGGWDCMRHYEIIANGCLPYFPDINLKPRSTMVNYPVRLQNHVNQLFLDSISNPNNLNLNHDVYDSLINEFKLNLDKHGMTSNFFKKLEIE